MARQLSDAVPLLIAVIRSEEAGEKGQRTATRVAAHLPL